MKQMYTRGPKWALSVLILVCLTGIGLFQHINSANKDGTRFSIRDDGSLEVKTQDLDLGFSAYEMTLDKYWQLHFSHNDPVANLHPEHLENSSRDHDMVFREIYPGSDLHIYKHENGRIAYDFVLQPGADISQIELELEGAGTVFISVDGELVLPTPDGAIHHSKPFTYQELEPGTKTEIASNFTLRENRLGFELGDYHPDYPVVIDPEIYFVPAGMSAAMFMDCCPENILTNPGFENNTYTLNENFPNASISPTANSTTTTTIDEWVYEDGEFNNAALPVIQDPTRASEGDQMLYIPLFNLGPTNTFNRCIGDALVNDLNPGQCPPTGSYNTGLRYVLRFDFVIFNHDVPAGGTGAGAGLPAVEYFNGPAFEEIPVYDENGNLYDPNGTFVPAVGWDDVSVSWETAYALTSGITGNSVKMYFSNANAATAGMLVDNIYVAPLQVSDPGLDNVTCGSANNQITFTLNPASNLEGAAIASYTVSAPAGYSISPTTGTYGMETAFTLTNNSGDFTPGSPAGIDITVEDEVNTNCSVIASVANPYPCCPVPTATVMVTEATCDGFSNNNDGLITVTTTNMADRYGVSAGATYSGPDYSAATEITATPFTAISSIPNAGGTYTIRFFNAEDACYFDEVVSVEEVDCLPAGAPACTEAEDAIGGIAWLDSNNNGAIDEGEFGQRAVLVEVFECDNETPVGSVYTNPEGAWSVSGLSNFPYRVEFSNPVFPDLQNAAAGSDNASNVQFVEAGSCEVNFGLVDPSEYCQEDPLIAVVCFSRNNDPATEPTVVFINEGNARDFPGPALATDANGQWGIPAGSNAGNYPITAVQASSVGEIGTTFGMEWDQSNSRLLTGSFMRAFASIGTNGSANGFAEAAIYQIPINTATETPGTPALWLDLETLFGDDFAGTYISDPAYPGPGVFGRTGSNPNLIGYTGLGSIKFAPDYSELYAVNLYTREVLVIPVAADGSAPASSTEIKRFPLPDSECSGTWMDGRPLASVLGLGVHPETGRVYATLTCTGPAITDVTGYVYSFDPSDDTPAASDFNLELSIPLDIDRPATSPNTARFWGQIDHAWESVSANSVFYTNDPRTGFSLGNEFNVQHNQPWLAEVGFDQRPDGSYGMIVAERNRYHDLINGSFYVTGGVLFRACGGEGSWQLESNGSCGDYTSSVNWSFSGTNAGVYTSASSRFFMTVGREGTMGAGTLTMYPGSSEVIMPVMDNLFNSATSGITWLRTSDGGRSRDIRILGDYTGAGYDNTNFTKSNNWGAIAAMCEALPIEIGNYVWIDVDEDGIQDACELPLAELTVKLYSKPDGGDPELLATTATDENGNYYFSGPGRDDASWEVETGISAGTEYYIVFCGDEYDADSDKITVNGLPYSLTQANVVAGPSPDLHDSDATEFTLGSIGDLPAICITATGTDHSYDVGLLPPSDYGDLPEPTYVTLETNGGPQHYMTPGPVVRLGDIIDADDDGQPSTTAGETLTDGDDGDGENDDDGVQEPPMIFEGEPAKFTVSYTNEKDQPAKIVGYIDWDGNGQFDGPEEMQSTVVDPVSSGEVMLMFQVPLDGPSYSDLGARFRISTDQDAVMDPNGSAPDGEVEDYLVEVKEVDFGDLPDPAAGVMAGNYRTSREDDGPRHGVPENPVIFLGTAPDTENDGTPDPNAVGDGPDEDGVGSLDPIFTGETAEIPIQATNADTDNSAKLVVFVDWNNDGEFAGAAEMSSVIIDPETIDEEVIVPINVPLEAVTYEPLGMRVRISSDPGFITNMLPTGFVMDGEVEDYFIQVNGVDFGDLPDVFIVEHAEGGPRHGLSETPLVYIGSQVDEEDDGNPSPSAGQENDGDDGTGEDDEDGVTKPEEIFRGQTATFTVDVVNESGVPAKLVGFVDWNRNQAFDGPNEMSAVTVESAMGTQTIPVVFDVPQDAGFYLPFTGVRFRISTDPVFFTEDGMSAIGFLLDGEVEDCLIEVNPVDYGDLPESYGTLLIDDGASHGRIEEPELYLGESVDEDFDGQPGIDGLALGDDEDDTDDEDGVTFLTPLFPGSTAKVRVEVSIIAEVDAYLNAWIDFDGNGELDETDALEFTIVDGTPITPTTNLTVEDGTVDLCFTVPDDAVFAPGGMAYSRFRLSSEGNLAPDGFTDNGEVEDHKLQLAKVGNLVWRDFNYNGIQDEGEPGIESPTTVRLVYAGEDGEFFTDDDTEAETTTDENGLYYFCGLIEDPENMYKIIVESEFFPTLSNQPGVDDDLDSDGVVVDETTVSMMFLLDDIEAIPTEEDGTNDDPNDVGNFPDAVTDQTFDQGYAGFDYGDLPNEYLTTDASNAGEGTRHIFFPGKHLGSCLDLDLDGQPSAYGDGDDTNEGVYTSGTCAETGDDEDGITFLTPLIPGSAAKVEVTYTNIVGDEPENAYLNAWIDFNGDGVLDDSDRLNFVLLDETPVNSVNLPLAPAEAQTVIACFTVPDDAVFRTGNAYARFRMGCEEDMPSFGTVLGGEVEDYVVPLAKIGNLAWYDNDLDGAQDGEASVPDELGIPGVEFILTYAGYGDTEFGNDNDLEYTVTTDELGRYYFCGLIEGKYLVEVQKYDDDETDPATETPERYILTVPDLAGGNDVLDSDLAPGVMVMIPDLLEEDLITGEDGYLDNPGDNNGFPDNRDNLTLDAGWIPEPNIEALVNIAGLDFGPREPDNCEEFNIIVDICFKNTGYVEEEGVLVGAPLAELSATLDLHAEMGDAFVGLDGAPEMLAELGYDNTTLMAMPAAERLPDFNPDYDGADNTELLDGNGLLYPGENICVRLNVTINPTLVTMEEAMAIDLQGKVSGMAVNYQGVAIPDYFNNGEQYMAMDLSDNDWNFDGTYEDPDDAEAFGNCFKNVQPLVVPLQVNISANADCGVCIDPSEVVLSYQEACGEDDYPLGGFYRISVPGVAEDLTEVCVDGTDIVDGKFIFSVRTVNAPCNPSWGEVLLEDKSVPTLECPEDISRIGYDDLICSDIPTLLLEEEASYTVDNEGNILDISEELAAILDLTGYPTALDNCADLTVQVSDELIEGDVCEELYIKRTFWVEAVVQGKLETASCMQRIYFENPHLDDVERPKDVVLACTDEFETDDNGHPHPSETGYPHLISGLDSYDLAAVACNLGASYKDELIPICDGTYKLVRSWEVLDWCAENYERVLKFDQIIKVLDEIGPEVTCTSVDYDHDGVADLRTYSTGPYDCTASFEVPLPEVSDACSSWSVLTEVITDGVVTATVGPDATRYVSGIPVGCHEFRYTVTDNCGNVTVKYCAFQVLDQVAPIAVCDDDLNVSLGGQNYARVTAEDINEGSSDNCGPVQVEVRRRITDIENYECLDQFDYNGDGEVIGDEIKLSTEFGDPDGDGTGDEFYYTPWEPYVDFYCCDMNETVRIELRVWDDANGSGVFGDEVELPVCFDYAVQTVRDNYNVCWMDLFVEDKVPPVCTPPYAAEINCDDLPYDFDPQDEVQMTELFGAAEGFDNCGAFTLEELDANTDGLSDCGSGEIIRNFRVTDAKGIESATCQQVITVNLVHDYWIKFPADAEANCGTPVVDTIETSEGSCDLLAISISEEIYSASGDECYKIFRTYSVINWCEYDGESDPVVVSRDEDCDGKPGDEAVYVIVQTLEDTDPCFDGYDYGDPEDQYEHVWYDQDGDPFNTIPEAGTKGEDCDYTSNPTGFWKELVPITENDPEGEDVDDYPHYGVSHCEIASVGYWQYTQVIKVYDNVKPTIEFTAPDPFCSYSSDVENGCPAAVSVDFTITEHCTPDDLTITVQLDANKDGVYDEDVSELVSGTYPDYTITGNFPLGEHLFFVVVKDGCGNANEVSIPFDVVDCKAPAPICINGLAIELMPVIPAADADGDGTLDSGAMAIWASDFIASPMTDCTGEVTYSINRVGEENDPEQTGITLTCSDPASTLVEVWAYDEAGNGDFCETYVLVQDNMVQCDSGNGAIAGLITTEETEPVQGVAVELSGGQFQAMTSKADGHYQFSELAEGYDYTITPQLDVLPLNGVSTFDLVLMSKHILGIQPLESPYQRIAADVNNDKRVTAIDAIALRRLILNIDLEFSNNTSWRFIPKAYEFPNPENPWSEQFPEVINVNELNGELDQEDFIAVKIGDVDLNARANALSSEPRNTAGVFLLDVEEQELRAGNTYRVAFKAGQLADIQGYQLTLGFDPDQVALEGINYGIAGEENFGFTLLKEGLITTSWNQRGDLTEEYRSDAILFTLELRVTADSRLSDVIRVSNRLTAAEAYDQNNGLLDIGINFSSGLITKAPFELFQNVPNPFRRETKIGFYLPEAAEATLRIRDAGGRLIKVIRGTFTQGRNELILDRDDLAETGVLFYTLTVGDQTATKQMILVK